MKKLIISLVSLNAIIITLLFTFNLPSVRADLIKAWDDEWLMCRVNGVPSPNYREHSCFVGNHWVTCLEQDCTWGIYDPMD